MNMHASAKTLLVPLLFLTISPSISLCNNKFSSGFKIGINSSHLKTENLFEKEIKHPLGASFGFLSEFRFSKKFSIVGEIVFKKNLYEATYRNDEEGILETTLTSTYLYFPLSIKYLNNDKYIPYFLLGIAVGHPLKAEFNSYDSVYHVRDSGDLTSQLSKFEKSINLGMGKDISLKSFSIFIETRYKVGLTNNKNTKFYFPSKWQNRSLEFWFGVKF